jgi:hypothetical protein
MSWAVRRRFGLIPDRDIKRGGLRFRLNAQLIRQHLPAAFVQRQRVVTPAGVREQPHQPAIGCLAPGIDLELTHGKTSCRFVVAASLVIVDQVVERAERHLAQPLALDQQPLLKGHAVGEPKPRDEIAAVQFHGLGQSLRAAGAGGATTVRM